MRLIQDAYEGHQCTAPSFSHFQISVSPPVFAADDWRITTAGYGPAKIGMSVAEASAAPGMKLVSEGPVDNPECHYLRPEPAVGLWGQSRIPPLAGNADLSKLIL